MVNYTLEHSDSAPFTHSCAPDAGRMLLPTFTEGGGLRLRLTVHLRDMLRDRAPDLPRVANNDANVRRGQAKYL